MYDVVDFITFIYTMKRKNTMEPVLILFSLCIGKLLFEGVVLIIFFYRQYSLFTATETETLFHPIKGEYVFSREVPYRYYPEEGLWKRQTKQLFVEKPLLSKKAVLKTKYVWKTIPFEQSKHFHALIRE